MDTLPGSGCKTTKIRTKDVEADEPSCSFDDLQLNSQLLDGLKFASYFRPSPVQLKAIPLGKIGLGISTCLSSIF